MGGESKTERADVLSFTYCVASNHDANLDRTLRCRSQNRGPALVPEPGLTSTLTGIQDVMSRLNIEPDVRSVSWEKIQQ